MIIDMCRKIVKEEKIDAMDCSDVRCTECPFSWAKNDDKLSCAERDEKINIEIAKKYLNGLSNGSKLDGAIDHCREVASAKDTCKECADEHYELMSWLIELKELREFKIKIMEAIYE